MSKGNNVGITQKPMSTLIMNIRPCDSQNVSLQL